MLEVWLAVNDEVCVTVCDTLLVLLCVFVALCEGEQDVVSDAVCVSLGVIDWDEVEVIDTD